MLVFFFFSSCDNKRLLSFRANLVICINWTSESVPCPVCWSLTSELRMEMFYYIKELIASTQTNDSKTILLYLFTCQDHSTPDRWAAPIEHEQQTKWLHNCVWCVHTVHVVFVGVDLVALIATVSTNRSGINPTLQHATTTTKKKERDTLVQLWRPPCDIRH